MRRGGQTRCRWCWCDGSRCCRCGVSPISWRWSVRLRRVVSRRSSRCGASTVWRVRARRELCRRRRGRSGGRRQRLDALQHRRVDHVHEQHGLEERVCQLRLLREQLPRLLGLRRNKCLGVSTEYAFLHTAVRTFMALMTSCICPGFTSASTLLIASVAFCPGAGSTPAGRAL